MTAREALASLPLHERIAAVIEASGQGQDAFADQLGIHRETVNRWVNGRSRPNRTMRVRLAECAAELYGEPVTADLFRDGTPTENVGLEDAIKLLAEATTELIGLLAEQRHVVGQLQRIADALAQPGDAGPPE